MRACLLRPKRELVAMIQVSKYTPHRSEIAFQTDFDDCGFYCYYGILLHRLKCQTTRIPKYQSDFGNHCLSKTATK